MVNFKEKGKLEERNGETGEVSLDKRRKILAPIEKNFSEDGGNGSSRCRKALETAPEARKRARKSA